jgi:hypothetical protein
MVTVGQSRTTGNPSEFNHEKLMYVYRSMPTAVENGALQRVAGGKEQGCDQDIWQVLDVGDGVYVAYWTCVMLSMIMNTLSYAAKLIVPILRI